MFLLVEGSNAEHRTGLPLTLATMADAYNIRIGGYLDSQGTTRAMRGSRHSTPPSAGAVKLQESGCQNDRLLSIVLVAPVALGEVAEIPQWGLRGATRQPPCSSRSIRSTRAQLSRSSNPTKICAPISNMA
jgi:hypothetical protein